MRILILANNDVGLYKFRKELIHELLKNHEVIISLPNGECVEPLIKMGCRFIDTPVDRRGINPITDLKLLGFYNKLLKKEKPDLVITYTIKPNIYGSMIAKMQKIPYVVNITGLGTAFQSDNWLKKLVVTLYKNALSRVKCVLFENVENLNLFVENKIVNKSRTKLLNGAGVNLEEYPFQTYPSKDENIRFLFVGRVMKEKGINEYLEAAAKIKKDYPEVIFDVVGPMEDDYKVVIEQYQNVINYYGFQNDVKPFIKQAHCFVLPSYHEGMANTLLESASMGRPLITSNIHGCKEAVSDNGYLCEVKCVDSLHKQMKKFIDLDYENKVQLGLNSRKHMENVFDKNKVVDETIKEIFK